MIDAAEHAHKLARSFSVIPAGIDKRPLIAWKEFQTRKASDEERRRWFEGASCNIGIVTGEVSGLAVLDADSRETVEWCEANLPLTPTVETARGRHYYFKFAPGLKNTVAVNGLKLDIRAEGGYVIGPGSIHETGVIYSWLEGRSLDDLPLAAFPSELFKHDKKPSTMGTGTPGKYGQAALASELSKLAGASQGERNNALNQAAFSLGQLVAGGELNRGPVEAALTGTALSLGLSEAEARATIRSGFEAGSREPRTAPESGRRETTGERETDTGIHETPSPLRGLRPASDIELYARPEVENPALLASLIFIARLHLLSAYMKSGKTEFILQMIHAILRGEDFIGLPTKKTRVLLISEMAETDVLKTFRKLGHTPEGGLFIHGREAGPFTLDKGGLNQLGAFVRENNIGLVVLDVISRFWLVADENSATEVEKALLPLLTLCGSTGAAVLLAHHETKAGGEHGRGIRGSGGIFGTVDQALMLGRHGTSKTKRVLKTLGRFPESPDELLLDYVDGKYVTLGDPSGIDVIEAEHAIADALVESMTRPEIIEATALPPMKVRRVLDALVRDGFVLRSGTGKKGDPFVFKMQEFV